MMQALLGPIIGMLTTAVDKAIPDKDQAEKIKAQITLAAMNADQEELQGAIKIINTEAQGESWLQRNWRPVLMLWFAALVGAHWLGFTAPNLPTEVVSDLLAIVQVGVGGYVIGRSAEKGIKAWREND